MLFKVWDKQGYANYDISKAKIFGLTHKDYPIIEGWVREWNKQNGIEPLKYLQEDFKFRPINPNLYITEDSEKNKKIRIQKNNISFIINLQRIEVSMRNEYVFITCEIDRDSITDNGRSIYDNLYGDVPSYDDLYFEIFEDYRDEIIEITNKEFQEKYTNKMGYDLEIEF